MLKSIIWFASLQLYMRILTRPIVILPQFCKLEYHFSNFFFIFFFLWQLCVIVKNETGMTQTPEDRK